jgi:hypothetical protein
MPVQRPVDRPVELGPINPTDVGPVAEFLSTHLNTRVPRAAWSKAMKLRWVVDAPNHGFLLRDGDDIVGAYLAFYSERQIAGRVERICNLGAWCVLEEYRSHGLRLLRAMLAQRDYTFTDLSPSGNVIPLNKRLRFTTLDTTTAAMPNLPWKMRRSLTVTSDHTEIRRGLSGRDLQIFQDHVEAPAARHVLVVDGGETCYIILRRDRRKRLPIFGSLLYVSNRTVFARAARAVAGHLLLRHRILVTLAELRVVGSRPPGSFLLPRARPKMFKSNRIESEQVDYLYSELTSIAW